VSTHGTLTAHALTVGYRIGRETRSVCANIDVVLAPGELVCLLGPNGAGKSTLMNTLAGALQPLAGTVLLDGVAIQSLSVRERAQRIAIVTTERLQATGLSGYALVALGRHPHTGWLGALTANDTARIEEALLMATASAFRDRQIGELSDGERQRLLLARALAQASSVLILDELTAFLDLPRRVETMHTLRRLAREAGRAVLLSTHDLDLALRSADRIWLLPRDGTLATGIPESLILNGTFAAAFAAEGVEFDINDGNFRVHQSGGRAISVRGPEPTRHWTEHALLRLGWKVTDGAELSITIDASQHWEVRSSEEAPVSVGVGLDALLTLLGRGSQ